MMKMMIMIMIIIVIKYSNDNKLEKELRDQNGFLVTQTTVKKQQSKTINQ